MRIALLLWPAALALCGCGWFQKAPARPKAAVVEKKPQPPEQPRLETRIVKKTPARKTLAREPEQPQEDSQLKDRFITVSAKCESAEESYKQLKADSVQSGRALHPDISTAYFRMKTSLDMAKRELEGHQDAEARHTLEVAELSATKVLRAAGGH